MKFTFSWLRQHLNTHVSLDVLLTALISLGIEVESCVNLGEGFVVAKVLDVIKHPQADKLSLCVVSDGKDELQIVCGAHNVRTGLRVVLAKIGAVIPSSSTTIKKSKIRGCDSFGMLCSASELGLPYPSDDSGILELDDQYEVGKQFTVDPLIDISVTPNRGDVLSIHGIARELSAAGYGDLICPTAKESDDHEENFSALKMKLLVQDACSSFAGIGIAGVRNCASPDWLAEKLDSIGVKSISAIVDVLNYVMFSYGYPLHVYDSDKIVGSSIIVKRNCHAREMLAIDGKVYVVPENAIITEDDDANILAVAGVMGSSYAQCRLSSTNIFIECGLFSNVDISKVSRALKLTTEASYRFERGVDSSFMEDALLIASSMIKDICGGEISVISRVGQPEKKDFIRFEYSLFEKITGITVEYSKILQILQNLGFEVVENDNIISVKPPSWRNDISQPQCIVEEILRVHGYDNLLSNPIPAREALNVFEEKVEDLCRMTLLAIGFSEVITWSFMSEKKCIETENLHHIKNPIGKEFSVMRPSILHNLVDVVCKNANNGLKEIKIFEIGKIYTSHKEIEMLSFVMYGDAYKRNIYEKQRKVDFFDIKGVAERILDALNQKDYAFVSDKIPGYYHPGKAVRIMLSNIEIGFIGELHPNISSGRKIIGAEIALNRLQYKAPSREKVFAKLQSVEREFCFVFDSELMLTVGEVCESLLAIDKKIINISLIDKYDVEKDGKNQISLSFLVIMLHPEKNLSSEEINDVSDRIIRCMEDKFSGVLRLKFS